jgi:aspartyl-tRNA(Asn)/glutamyl-tRNA(Gln) amidotransferase subunit C
MSVISRSDVEHLAKLARLALNEDELEHYAKQLDVILQAVAKVSEAVSEDIPGTSHPVPTTNVFREDVVGQSLSTEDLLAGAPSVEDVYFRVPRILDES